MGYFDHSCQKLHLYKSEIMKGWAFYPYINRDLNSKWKGKKGRETVISLCSLELPFLVFLRLTSPRCEIKGRLTSSVACCLIVPHCHITRWLRKLDRKSIFLKPSFIVWGQDTHSTFVFHEKLSAHLHPDMCRLRLHFQEYASVSLLIWAHRGWRLGLTCLVCPA